MFFTYAEKESNFLFDSWKLREVAFDTTRRYLYYSVEIKGGLPIAPPNACDDVNSMPTPPPIIASPTQSQPPRRGRRNHHSPREGVDVAAATAAAANTNISLSSSGNGNASAHSSSAQGGGRGSRRRHTTHSNPSPPRSHEDSTRSSVYPFPYVVSTLTAAHTASGSHTSSTTLPIATASTTTRAGLTNPMTGPPARDGLMDGNSSSYGAASGNRRAVAQIVAHAGGSRNNASAQGSSIVAAPTDPPPLPHPINAIVWKKKIKVDGLVPTFKDHVFMLDDPYLSERDFWQLEIYGELRTMQPNEHPPEGPLLCRSSGFAGLPERCTAQNSDYVCDRYFLGELYESLRNQFADMRAEQDRLALQSAAKSNLNQGGGQDGGGGGEAAAAYEPPRPPHIRTWQSPRKKGSTLPLHGGSRVRVVLRMRNEYEMRRFWFVLQTVIGYDKLTIRPYRGLPPYDPRNGLIFAQVPPHVYHIFKMLDKAVMYIFLRCDVIGRDKHDFPSITLHGCYFCITHDTIMILRETATVARWLSLNEVKSFHYNIDGPRPYLSFIADDAIGAPDLIVLLQPPVFGREAIRQFSPALETLRVLQVVHELSFASLDIRRVIELKEATEPSVRQFVQRLELSLGRRLRLDRGRHVRIHPLNTESHRTTTNDTTTTTDYNNSNEGTRSSNNNLNGDSNENSINSGTVVEMSCPLPHEQLAQVWREVQDIYASRDPTVVSQSAIPVYENNTNDLRLTATQLSALTEVMARERVREDDIVGMPYDELRNVEARLAEERVSHAAAHRHRPRSRLHRHHPTSEHPSSPNTAHPSPSPLRTEPGGGGANTNVLHSELRLLPTSDEVSVLSEQSDIHSGSTQPQRHHRESNHSPTWAASTSPPVTNTRTTRTHAQPIPQVSSSQSTQSHTRFANEEMLAHPIVQSMLVTPQMVNDSFAARAVHTAQSSTSGSLSSSTSGSAASSSDTESESSDYGMPGSRYVTREEMEHNSTQPFKHVYTDKHVILMGATPVSQENNLVMTALEKAKTETNREESAPVSLTGDRRGSYAYAGLTVDIPHSHKMANHSPINENSNNNNNTNKRDGKRETSSGPVIHHVPVHHTALEGDMGTCAGTEPNSPLGPWEPNVNDMVHHSITALHNSMSLTREAAREVMAASLPKARPPPQHTVLSTHPASSTHATAHECVTYSSGRRGSASYPVSSPNNNNNNNNNSSTCNASHSRRRESAIKQQGEASNPTSTSLDT